MLADIGRDDRRAARQAMQLTNHRLRFDLIACAVEAERLCSLPRAYLLPPCGAALDARFGRRMRARLRLLAEGDEGCARIGGEGEHGRDVLADVGRVDVYVDDARMWREGSEFARHAVVE